jgi:hypothetical protein
VILASATTSSEILAGYVATEWFGQLAIPRRSQRRKVMPKYGVHQVVLANAIDGLSASGAEAGRTLAQNYDIAMLGAIGPDLFFWAPDYLAVRTLKGIYTAYAEVKKLYDAAVKPIEDIFDAVGDVMEDVLPATYGITQAYYQELKETTSLLEKTMTTGALATALGGINLLTDAASLPSFLATLFALFTPPRQFNKDEQEWYWFDMLHYRNTGDFARNLVLGANTGRQLAYAYGYLSHIATDLTGHPYVNQIVGGPFRLHLQRHAIVENFIDSWVFDEEYGQSINQTLFKKLALREPKDLPDEILELINGAFRSTYTVPGDRPKRGFLTMNELYETYDNLYIVLEMMDRLAVPYPTNPFPALGRILADALEDLLQPPPNPPSILFGFCSLEEIFAFGTTPDSRDCYDTFFAQLDRYFGYIGSLVEWLFETLLDLLDLLLAGVLTIPVSAQLALLYGIQIFLYDVYHNLRYMLVLGGLLYPEPRDLNSSVGRNMTTTFQRCIPDLGETYPNQAAIDISPLVCPPLELERKATVPGFSDIGSYQVTPFEFIRDVPFVPDDFWPYARAADAQATETLHHETLHHQRLRVGNAIGLTQWMITVASNEDLYDQYGNDVFANFDLDADRGYFHKTWEGKIEPDRVRGFRYI